MARRDRMMPNEPKRKKPQRHAAAKRLGVIVEERRYKAAHLWLVEKKPDGTRYSYREIGELLGVSHQAVCNDVNSVIEEMSAELKEAISVNVRKEFMEQLRFAKKLRKAAEDYLSSDTDPLRLVLIPRADEIDVAYYDFADTNQKGEPKRKTATLHELMAKVEGGLNAQADKISIKHVDMRKFALDAINTTDTCIDKFAKLGGEYMREKPNPADIEKALEAYRLWADKNPAASLEERREAVRIFATGREIDVTVLAEKAGIMEVATVQ